jgi:hypothetical protein
MFRPLLSFALVALASSRAQCRISGTRGVAVRPLSRLMNHKKPTALKIIQGNPGRRPISANEPQPEIGADPPDWLSPAAKEHWPLIVQTLRGGTADAHGSSRLSAVLRNLRAMERRK